ncbi:Alpha-ketoglutarate-dependent sulfonate dioxygenase [Mycena venus]|uniref:Alpha-ketoglutarate-dependent sulfonate dioxygenase n=1 Tax=Mycena venus TaxID=2733690 RepID=A0A8H6XPL9_9AGAR|nr:Alpha-ketoglutarate-dependent sulfonate dioxygenase [Mycena venus]
MPTATTTTELLSSSQLNGGPKKDANKTDEEPYKYAHLMQTWSTQKYPPLEPFEHVDAGSRALKHPKPRSFLESANVTEMTPEFGSDVRGCNLAELSSDQKDQLALEVARRGVIVFRGQEDFIDRGPKFYTEWGRHFGPLHIHPLAGHPEGYPDIHLVYKDKNSRFNVQESITTTVWHSDCSFELQPAGLTAFWLLSQPETGGDTLYASQVLNLRSLSPIMANFLRTLKATHSAFGTMRSKGRRGSLYVNKQMTKSIVGMKREESDVLLNFLYDHVAMSTDHQVRIKWEPMSVVVWDNHVTSHTATSDYAHLKARRHGARISAQSERPIPTLDSLKMDD